MVRIATKMVEIVIRMVMIVTRKARGHSYYIQETFSSIKRQYFYIHETFRTHSRHIQKIFKLYIEVTIMKHLIE